MFDLPKWEGALGKKSRANLDCSLANGSRFMCHGVYEYAGILVRGGRG